MFQQNSVTQEKLASTYALFLPKERINKTALPHISQEKKQKDKFEKKYGMLYTAGAIAVGGGILFALHRGGQLFNLSQYLKKKITKLSAKMSEKTEKAQNKNLTFLEKIQLKTYLLGSKIWKTTLETTNVLCNLNPFKDICFDRLMKCIHLKGAFDWITKKFTQSAKKLTAKKYITPREDLAKLQFSLFEAAKSLQNMKTCRINGQIVSGEEAAKQLTGILSDLVTEMSKITDESFNARFDSLVKTLNENSEKEFLNVFKNYTGNNFKEKFALKVKECGDYLPQKIMEKYKQEAFSQLLTTKQTISNNVLDLVKTLSKNIDDIFYNNSLENPQLRENYKKIKELLKKFKSPKEYSNARRAELKQQIINEINNAILKFQKINPNDIRINQLEDMKKHLLEDKKGLVEQAVSMCKDLKELNPNLYNKIIQERNKFQKSFAHAIDFETNKTYNKLLDFSLHSLATDIISMLVGFGTIGYIALNNKKNKQQKISANLELGVPLLGGMVVGFLCNLRQVASGAGAIVIGLISTAVLNRLGSFFSHSYEKKFIAKEQKLNNATSQTKNT